ncbi:MAG TPA: YCF48-related protein [Ignavibacteriaceae bacterium]|nr:YCF48-related protein [Ignavibacteriaceae bacterium]
MKLFLYTLSFIFASAGIDYCQPVTWTAQQSPTAQNLYGIAFIDSSTWVAVGNDGIILRSTDGGTSWSLVSSPSNDQLRSVTFLGSVGLAVGISGRVLRSTDSGLNWIEETRPTTRNLYSVSISSIMAVITGEEGTILVSYDGGLTWTSHTAGTASILFGVSVNDSTAVGVGGQGAVVMSVDGGTGWGLTILGQNIFFYSTSFINGSTGWAVGSSLATGNVIIHSTDYGFVWSAQSAPTTEQLFGVSFASLTTGFAVGTGGAIIYTTNGGITWLNSVSGTFQTLSAVAFIDTIRGIAVGDGGTILKSSAGGPVKVVEERNPQPYNFSLEQNYPNPFNPSTQINYSIPEDGFVSLKLYNLLGKEIAEPVNGIVKAGKHRFTFNASSLPSGVYLYRLETNNKVMVKKMMLIK